MSVKNGELLHTDSRGFASGPGASALGFRDSSKMSECVTFIGVARPAAEGFPSVHRLDRADRGRHRGEDIAVSGPERAPAPQKNNSPTE